MGNCRPTSIPPLIAKVLDDEGSVLEVRHAAAEALADLGNPAALAVLKRTAREHPFATVRQVARDALAARGLLPETADDAFAEPEPKSCLAAVAAATAACVFPTQFDAMVFVKGDNNLPTTWHTIEPEQADRWRQTYVVTDEGPSYRPGNNLYVLRLPRPDGKVTPLTRFSGGYVAEPEVTWDGRQVIFIHREADNPWWHVWRVNVDASGLEQLTRGPYQDVGPVQLADGRIAFASSRSGIRDEYHGYPCTALHVIEPDGSDLHPIATNIGRDNEPGTLARRPPGFQPVGGILFAEQDRAHAARGVSRRHARHGLVWSRTAAVLAESEPRRPRSGRQARVAADASRAAANAADANARWPANRGFDPGWPDAHRLTSRYRAAHCPRLQKRAPTPLPARWPTARSSVPAPSRRPTVRRSIWGCIACIRRPAGWN